MGIRFERTHNLLALLDQVVTVEGEWELLRPNLVELNQFAVAFRYPGRDADRSLARRAHKFCLAVRDAFRQRLRLRVGRRPTKRTRRRSTTGRRARRARWGRNR
ncbi:MAG TPA: HEPN domain-containing protein [Phycisphaerae bacterium]